MRARHSSRPGAQNQVGAQIGARTCAQSAEFRQTASAPTRRQPASCAPARLASASCAIAGELRPADSLQRIATGPAAGVVAQNGARPLLHFQFTTRIQFLAGGNRISSPGVARQSGGWSVGRSVGLRGSARFGEVRRAPAQDRRRRPSLPAARLIYSRTNTFTRPARACSAFQCFLAPAYQGAGSIACLSARLSACLPAYLPFRNLRPRQLAGGGRRSANAASRGAH